ncbi:MAG TPA: MAPEG family protein [Marinagarivorans sp.]
MLYAMFGMVALTTVVGILAVTSRVRGVRNKQISIKVFRTMQGDLPDFILRTTRNYNNQFELPVLFYLVCTLYIVLQHETLAALITAWAFVASRVLHAFIHLTANNIMHRMLAFWLGVILVLGLWINLVVQYSAS